MGCIKKKSGILDINVTSNSLKLRNLNVHEKISLFMMLKESTCKAQKGSNGRAYVILVDNSNGKIGKIYLTNHSSKNNIKYGNDDVTDPLVIDDKKILDKLIEKDKDPDVWEVKTCAK